MTSEPLLHLRKRIADVLERMACAFCSAAHRIRPVYMGPLCPDCEVAPDPGPGGGCSACADNWVEEQRVKAMYEPAWDQGYEAGYRDSEMRP